MTNAKELCARLRDTQRVFAKCEPEVAEEVGEAADLIEQQSAEIERLKSLTVGKTE